MPTAARAGQGRVTPPRPILIGCAPDGSVGDVLALGELLARTIGLELLLACVYVDEPAMAQNFRLARQREAEQTVDAALERIESSGLVRHGRAYPARSVTRGLAELALAEEPELLVIGSRHTSLGRLLSGSVTERLFATSSSPVAIAPRDFAARRHDTLSRIGVGYDGSMEARAALAKAAELAETTDAELRVTVVCDSTASPGLEGTDHASLESRRRAEAEARLEEALVTLGGGKRATGAIVAGAPAAALEATAKSDALDLLVIGSRGYGPFHAVAAGGVSSHLARHVLCPLVVVAQPTPPKPV